MEPEVQWKIEQTVLDILKNADMENTTEFKVRVTASDRLGIDLTDAQSKKIVRGVVESFLLSAMEMELAAEKECDVAASSAKEKVAMPRKEFDSEGNRVICKLANKRNVVIQDFKGKSFVCIREFYRKDGRQLPTNKGINLSAEQWSTFRTSVPLIEEAIAKMQSKLRSNILEQNEVVPNFASTSTSEALNGKIPETSTSHGINGQASKSVNASMPHEPSNRLVPEMMTTSTPHELNGEICDSAIAPTPHELVRFEINRFNGKDYNYWAPMMELFLKQLKLAHVLTDPCPSLTIRPEAGPQDIAQARAAERKWFNDDYMCRHNILACLSDPLYKRYSSTKSAKELWEELKLVYLHEEFGKKRYLVKSYIEFQIADEKPIFEQVRELNTIADSIVAAGIHFDEKFHVSAIISKLPPSWKDFCMKLVCEEHLPFGMLMDRIRMENDSRNCDRRVQPPNSASLNYAKNLDPRTKAVNKQAFTWKRHETETDNNALICYFCGKKGHISKNCRNKKLDKENSSTAAVTEIKKQDSSEQPNNVVQWPF